MELFGIEEIGIVVSLLVAILGGTFVFRKKSSAPKQVDSLETANSKSRSEPLSSSPQLDLKPSVKVPTWSERLERGLARTRGQLKTALSELFLSSEAKLSREQMLEQLFEILIQSDVGVETSEWLVNEVRTQMSTEDIGSLELLQEHLRRAMLALLGTSIQEQPFTLETPAEPVHVVMMVGVNGVGKTTTTGKLAHKSTQQNRKVVIAAADTFRAAAVEQLQVWAERSGAKLWKMAEGADPASVAFEAVREAKNQGSGICIIDTAGRLHNRNDLMQELAKIKRVTSKEIPDAPHEVLLVVDATTGQNAVMQARVFKEIAGVTGVVLTKLDGTAKGGVVLAIVKELKLPIRYIGVGEAVDDLQVFNPVDYVNGILEMDGAGRNV